MCWKMQNQVLLLTEMMTKQKIYIKDYFRRGGRASSQLNPSCGFKRQVRLCLNAAAAVHTGVLGGRDPGDVPGAVLFPACPGSWSESLHLLSFGSCQEAKHTFHGPLPRGGGVCPRASPGPHVGQKEGKPTHSAALWLLS